MKVFVVMHYDYSSTHLEEVFATRELALECMGPDSAVEEMELWESRERYDDRVAVLARMDAEAAEKARQAHLERLARLEKVAMHARERDELLGVTTGPGTWRGTYSGHHLSDEQIKRAWERDHGEPWGDTPELG